MKLIIVKSNLIITIASWFTAVNIIGVQFLLWLFVHDLSYWKAHRDNNTIKWIHEMIHFEQGKELGFIFFWLLYFINWFVNLLIYRDLKKAYKNIAFEKEAYYCEGLINYLRVRKRYNWLKWVF